MNAQLSVPEHRTMFCIAEQIKKLKRVPLAAVRQCAISAVLAVPSKRAWPVARRARFPSPASAVVASDYGVIGLFFDPCVRWRPLDMGQDGTLRDICPGHGWDRTGQHPKGVPSCPTVPSGGMSCHDANQIRS